MLNWRDTVEKVKGLGPRRCEFLHSEGFHNVGDILMRAPVRFIDRRESPPFNRLQEAFGKEITAVGTVESYGEKGRSGKRRFIVNLGDGSGGYLSGVWFNNYRFVKPKIKPGVRIAFSGKVGFFDGPQMTHPKLTFLDKSTDYNLETGLIPIYPSGDKWTKHGFTRTFWVKLITYILKDWDGSGPYIPDEIRKFDALLPFKEALKGLHLPENIEEYDQAVESLKYAELFHHQLLMIALRRRRRQQGGIKIEAGEKIKKFIAALPFKLSDSQKEVLKEIANDMKSGRPMHRLMQGEVGAGKTVVALAAAALVADGGRQTMIMAPTELLARQHYHNALEWFPQAGMKAVLLAAGRHSEEIKRALYEASTGGADVIIGTHALFQERVKVKQLGLVIIDEQQRFGVRQRAQLINKGVRPHVLLMTATPIPRTLSLAYYGDLELSILKMRPGVLRNVFTTVRNDSVRDKVFAWLRGELKKGKQGYLIFPVIDEGAAGLEAAEARFEPYQKIDFKGIPVGLMHGRQPIEERIRTMEAFRDGRIKLLMATSVVEVGVDVPQASLMVIENSEHFGLSPVHQLRGRIGRLGQKSYCILLTKELDGDPGWERLKKLETCSDGFTLAEEDLKMRGGGEPLGARQSGIVKFKIADLSEDLKLLKKAHLTAEWLFDKYPKLEPFPELRKKLREDYRNRPRTLLAG